MNANNNACLELDDAAHEFIGNLIEAVIDVIAGDNFFLSRKGHISAAHAHAAVVLVNHGICFGCLAGSYEDHLDQWLTHHSEDTLGTEEHTRAFAWYLIDALAQSLKRRLH